MANFNTTVALFGDHQSAEAAIKILIDGGIEAKHLGVVGRRGSFWGGLWAWLFGAVFVFVPVIGHAVLLDYYAAAVTSTSEGAVVVGGLSPLGAGLYGMGIPEDSVVAYETALKAGGFLVMAHGPDEEMKRARTILMGLKSSCVDSFAGKNTVESTATVT